MLGNWITDPDAYPVQVHAIEGLQVQVSQLKHGLNALFWEPIDLLSPIPLTPELMKKINPKWIGFESQWGIEIAIAARTTLVLTTGGNVFVAPGTTIENIQYLHELQNHYRWATGKKLEVKL